MKARHQLISFSSKIVYCRVPSEVENAAIDILGKIESIKAPDPVSLGFDPEWRALSKKRFVVLSILIWSSIFDVFTWSNTAWAFVSFFMNVS